MDYKNTIDSLLIDIEEIKNLIQKFKDDESISQIEMDLLLSKIRNLYDILLIIESENKEKSVLKKDLSKKEVDKDEKDEKTVERSDDFSLEEPYNLERVDNQAEELDSPDSEDEDKNIEIIADKYQSTSSRNESIGEKTNVQDVSSKLQSKPLEDIKKAIGINDRFLFIKELFEGNANIYNETIDIINNADNYIEVLNHLKANYDWDYKSDVVIYFLDIVKRKFAIET